MADDLDAELLALAGDDASDEESSKPKQDIPPASSSPRSPEPSSMGRKRAAKPAKRVKRSREDEEDGEL